MATTVLISSLAGIHQNSNLLTGGGTDDTTVIQTALSASYPGGLILVQDGVSLVSGLNIGANTTLLCNANCGFYLANASNREILRNVNRSATIITDTNITISGGFYNGNKANQSGVNQSDNTPMAGFGFYGIENLTIQNLEVFDASAWEIGIGNFLNVTVNNCSLIATTAISNLNTDGIDLRGPGSNATLSNLTILSGDDGIALNSRNYGSAITGPFIGGGNISGVRISNVLFEGAWSAIDLLSDGTFEVFNITVNNLYGTVQNYALYLNRDIFNSPAGNGSFDTISVSNCTLTQTGTPFGGGIPPGLYLIDGATGTISFTNISPIPVSASLVTSAAAVTSFLTNGAQKGPASGPNTSIALGGATVGLTFVQQNINTVSTGTSMTIAYGSNTTGGSYLIAYVLVHNAAGSPTVTSVTDTLGNTWILIGSGNTPPSNVYLYQCLTNKSGGGANTVTFNFSGATDTAFGIAAEYTGQKSPVVDQPTLLSGGVVTGTTYSAPSVKAKRTNETIIGIGASIGANAVAAAGGFTLRSHTPVQDDCMLIDMTVSLPGIYTPQATSTSSGQEWQLFSLSLISSASKQSGRGTRSK